MYRRSSIVFNIASIGLIVIAIASATIPGQPSSAAQAVTGQGESHYIGFVPPAFTDPFYVEVADGVRSLAAQKGWRLEVYAPAVDTDSDSQGIIVQQFLQKGIEAISVNAFNIDSMTAGVKAANAAHVPFVVHNSITPVSDPTAQVASYVGFDQWGGAEKLGRYTCQLLATKYSTTPEKAHGKIFILLDRESVSSHRRTQGYKAGLTVCPDVQIVGEQPANGLRETGAEVATGALQKTPDIDVFFGTSDEMNIGAALAADKLGLKSGKDFFSLGIDGNKPTLDLIKQGQVTATLGVDPFRMGQTVINVMETVLNGGQVPQVLLTPSVVVDASNLDGYLSGKTWTEPVAGSPEVDNGKPTVQTSSVPATTQATPAPTASK